MARIFSLQPAHVLQYLVEEAAQHQGAHAERVEIRGAGVFEEQLPVGVHRAQKPHRPAGEAAVRDLAKVQHGRVLVARVLEQAVVQRVDGSAVAFELLQEDAVVQAQRAGDAARALLRCEALKMSLMSAGPSTRDVRLA